MKIIAGLLIALFAGSSMACEMSEVEHKAHKHAEKSGMPCPLHEQIHAQKEQISDKPAIEVPVVESGMAPDKHKS